MERAPTREASRKTPRAGRPSGARAASILLAATLLLAAAPARSSPSNGLPSEFRPSLPIFGGGKFVNFLDGNNQALTNAAAHVGFSLAIPLVSEKLWGRKGLWIAGLSWMALSLTQEAFFHAPANPGPAYPSEVRSDLITRLVPCATLLVLDALQNRGRASVRPTPELPPRGPGMPWPVGHETPAPGEDRVAQREPPSGTDSEQGPPATSAILAAQATVAIEPDPGSGERCTGALLFEGSPACTWRLGGAVEGRRVAVR